MHHQALPAVARQRGHFCARSAAAASGGASLRVLAHPPEFEPVAARGEREVGTRSKGAGGGGALGRALAHVGSVYRASFAAAASDFE